MVRLKVVCDKREYELPSLLKELKCRVKFKLLPSGDYIFGRLIAERKSYTQFVADWWSGQLHSQISSLLRYARRKSLIPMLVVEYDGQGTERAILVEEHAQTLGAHIWVILTANMTDTAAKIIKYGHKFKSAMDMPFREPNVILSEADDRVAILSQFPLIRQERAVTLLKKFGSLKATMKNIRKWKKIRGFGPKISEAAIGLWNARWKMKTGE